MKLSQIFNPSQLKTSTHVYNAIRAKHVLVWDRLWKPGLKPVTEEEHKKAAEKYGLHPSEYKPYEDSLGDYPRLPKIGAEAKDPFYPYDFPVLRRNFGDPLHAQEHNLTLERYSAGYDYGVTPRQAYLGFIGTMLGFFLIIYLVHPYPWFQPVTARQYPYQGVTHYTFEPAK